MPQPPTLIALSPASGLTPDGEIDLPPTISPLLRRQAGRDLAGRSVYVIVPASEACYEQHCQSKDRFVAGVQVVASALACAGQIAFTGLYTGFSQGTHIVVPWVATSTLLGATCTVLACTADTALHHYRILKIAEDTLREKAARRDPVIIDPASLDEPESVIQTQPSRLRPNPPSYETLFNTGAVDSPSSS